MRNPKVQERLDCLGQPFGAAARRPHGTFNFKYRPVTLAIQFAFALGAAEWALPAAASCVLDGAMINTAVTNSVSCTNTGTLRINTSGGTLTNATNGALNNTGTIVNYGTLANSGKLTNSGLITNSGSITSAGTISGKGTLNNTGTLTVSSGGNVNITNSKNLSGGKLTGGTWVVDSSAGKAATLVVGSGDITINDAAIELLGAHSIFNQLTGLRTNEGSLTIGGGNFTTKASFSNTGTLTVNSGGNVNIADSKNLSGGTLTGGTWVVDSSGSSKSKATLVVGSGNITTNDATIELLGANANFNQLSGLRTNKGSLTIGGGNSFKASSLNNTGTLTVISGGNVNISSSKNLSGGTLTGGTWVVDSSGGSKATLVVGSGNITTNDAAIELLGANSSFSQLTGLRTNEGSLTIGGGSFTTNAKIALNNTGTLTVSSGGNVNIADSKNLSGGTLAGGTWVVDSSGGGNATLAVGSGSITTNDAAIELLGANSSFNQLTGLSRNQGSLTIGAGDTFITNVDLANTGTLVTGTGGTLVNGFKFRNGGLIANAGTIDSQSTITNSGTFNNTGTLAGSGTYIQTAGQTIDNGIMTQKSIAIDGGTLSGAGIINGNVSIGNLGSVSPGNSPGTITINGNFNSSGTLVFEITGTGTGLYDVLNINGSATFTGGNVEFDFINGFNAVAGDSWDFLNAGSVSGWDTLGFTFNGLGSGLGWRINQIGSGTEQLRISAVPEPETYAMLLAGLALIALTVRRRKNNTSNMAKAT